MNKLTHFDDQGKARMVDVTEKENTQRWALAKGKIFLNEEILTRIQDKSIEKGDVLQVARVAGIMATKQTSNLIPMCHPLFISGVDVDFIMGPDYVECGVRVKTSGKTGVEMEALQGVTTCLLTIYDMCKALDKSMEIGDVWLEYKSGGKSGVYERGKNSEG